MKWGDAEKDRWYQEQKIQRSYLDQVVTPLSHLGDRFEVVQYGALSLDPQRYPLFLLKSKTSSAGKKTILVTGGVHGYETSGVQGALRFLQRISATELEAFHLVCVPCVSPWAYETINRWNPKAIDPNRSFRPNSPAEESALFLKAMKEHRVHPFAHIDLHETTDTDNTVFRPAKAARDGVEEVHSEIPDGFYLVGDSENPQRDFQKAIVEAVRKVTHIARPDENGCLIGEKIEQEGVINYPLKKLFLCTGFSDAEYTTTTEVYPDSPKVTPEICIEAQVTAVHAALKYLESNRSARA